MLTDSIIVLLVGHLLGDFYLQSEKMASEKNTSWKVLLVHAAIYCASLMIAGLAFLDMKLTVILALSALIGISHLAVDWFKAVLFRHQRMKRIDLLTVFSVDQAIHIAVIMLAGYWLIRNGCTIRSFSWLDSDPLLKCSPEIFTRWICAILIVLKPATVFIQIMLKGPKGQVMPYKADPSTIIIQESDLKAGRKIGIFERLIILVLVFLQQYTAIALVVTAKSVARFKKLEEEMYGNYYLLGTLASIMIALVAYAFCLS